jgi:DNA-binding NarL/FixJ family response regulator
VHSTRIIFAGVLALEAYLMKSAHINANLKVVVMDTDYYSLQSINSYLAWDRRTRVTALAETPEALWSIIAKTSEAEQPDVVIIDADHLGGAVALSQQIQRLRQRIPKVMVICLAQTAEPSLIDAAVSSGARGFLLKNEVRLHIAWAIIYGLDQPFIATKTIMRAGELIFQRHHVKATQLPQRRQYPELTERIKQAVELCVVKGMPAHLAADEMGISLHTIRSYIKEGYRILESYDETEYPDDMSPQERAFMRLTSFEEASDDEKK